MSLESLYQTFNRYRTLQTNRISVLPIAILMPHSACNCRCVMCDIWKGNNKLKQLTEEDVRGLLCSLKKLGTRQVVMSGGEALLHANFFRLCEMLKKEKIKISLLSTGLTLKNNASALVEWVDDIVVSLDGDEPLHDFIRHIPGAYNKIRSGIAAVRSIDPHFQITGRTVIHRMNFKSWPRIVDSARALGLDSISFLPADVSSTAFNRQQPWNDDRQHELLLSESELAEMRTILEDLLVRYNDDFDSRFILESPVKIRRIYQYYAASHGLGPFPYKKCNAPWVSAVIEADGSVRPCFFHTSYGNIKSDPLDSIVNGPGALKFRENLDMDTDPVCVKCVCYLHLPPSKNIF